MINRTADGLNVVYLKKASEAAEQDAAGGGAASHKSVNKGWGNNFVRIDMKVRLAGWLAGAWRMGCRHPTTNA